MPWFVEMGDDNEFVTSLITNDAIILVDNDCDPALHCLAVRNNSDAVRLLLATVDINTRSQLHYTKLRNIVKEPA